MDGIIEAFHLDVKLLMAQIINFTIVLAVLYKFAYQPLLKVMNERTGKIEKGLKDAQKAQEQLEKAEKNRDEKITEAKKEARDLLEKAREIAEKNREEILNKTKQDSKILIGNAKETIEAEKDKMIKEVRQEIGKLTGIALEKVLEERQIGEADKKIIKKATEEIEGSHQ
jgi:F-type H+-transporting ATPase subunit b